MEEWWAVANGPALWISGFILGGLAIVGAIFMQIQAINEGKKIGFGKDKVNEVRKSTLITSIGPGLGITFGMIPLMIALSPGVAWLRESAGVGSIMYELITASQGAHGSRYGAGTRDDDTSICLGLVHYVYCLYPLADHDHGVYPNSQTNGR